MAVKTFNYTNDRYIEAADTRAQIAALLRNSGYGFFGNVTRVGSTNTYTVTAGSLIFIGGLCVRVIEDEAFDLTSYRYIAVETSYEGLTDKYTCTLKGVNVVDSSLQGGMIKQYIIYDKTTGVVNLLKNVEDSITALNTQMTAMTAHKNALVTDTDGVHGLKIESGTFTPTITGSTTAGTHTYSIQKGSYYRIGNLVHVEIYIVMSAKDGTMAGNAMVSGLPFVSKNIPNKYNAVKVGSFSNVGHNSGYTQFAGNLPPNAISISLVETGSNNAAATIPATNIFSNSSIILTAEYEI